jgi:hypothetical protein
MQHLGLDVLPRHFYSEIPDIRKLRRETEWRRAYTMLGVAGADRDEQFAFLKETINERITNAPELYKKAHELNGAGGYGPIEAEYLLHYTASYRPSRVIQVGAGVSTSLILVAAEIVAYHPELT